MTRNWRRGGLAAAGVFAIVVAAGAWCKSTPGCLAESPRARPVSVELPSPVGEKKMSLPLEIRRGVEHADHRDFTQKVLESDVPVLVDFYADWCGPCRRLAPVLEEVAKESPHAKVVKVNVDDAPQLAAKYGVNSIPYLAVFKGGRLVDEHVGLADKRRLKALLDD